MNKELQIRNSVCRNFRHTAADGKNYQVKFYALEAILAISFFTMQMKPETIFCHS
jgi:hypothetical protein